MGCVLALSISGSVSADSSSTPRFAIVGAVKTPMQVTRADLGQLPSQEVAVSFMTGRGKEEGQFKGVLLWTLLDRAGVLDGTEKGAHLRHVVVVTGQDGYAVALSMGELDPKFEGKQVLIAYDENGTALPASDGLRLVVPGDHHGGRAVRDVEKVEVQ